MGALAGIAIGSILIIGMLSFYFCVHRNHHLSEHEFMEDMSNDQTQGTNQDPKVGAGGASGAYQMTGVDPQGSHAGSSTAEVDPSAKRVVCEISVVSTTPTGRPRTPSGRLMEGGENRRNNLI
jgi:hypothetical protein